MNLDVGMSDDRRVVCREGPLGLKVETNLESIIESGNCLTIVN